MKLNFKKKNKTSSLDNYLKINDYNDLFLNEVRFIMRRSTKESLEFYKNTQKEIKRSFEILYLLDLDITKTFTYELNCINLPYSQFEEICSKYINICREESNTLAGYAIFSILSCGLYYYKNEASKYILGYYKEFTIKASKEDIDFANKHFSKEYNLILDKEVEIKFTKDTTKILNYKGLKLYVYTPYDMAYLLTEDDKVRTFDLIWDWWYPIDSYLYLEKDWKKK